MTQKFTKSRAGKFVKNLTGEIAYKSFLPTPLPPTPPIQLDDDMFNLLLKATSQLSILDNASKHIPNMDLFVSMYVRKEALMSSQIEGTQATLEDVLDPTINENTNRDVVDVVNYIKATKFAVKRLESLPLCNRLLQETHAKLMQGVRGQEKNPGEFRRSQNWIGGSGSTLKNARYIPPAPDDMTQTMSDLEKYINGTQNTDDSNDERNATNSNCANNADCVDRTNVLICCALIHYQFETIHPFLDGNGRIGRLLVTLYLMQEGVLSSPALYISFYLKKNRVEYYDRMSEVRAKGNYEQWVEFFLQALYECALDANAAIEKLSALHDENVVAISKMGRGAKNARTVFDYLEANPIIDIGKTAKALELSFNTVSSAISRLESAGILEQTTNASRNRTFVYTEYLDILREGT